MNENTWEVAVLKTLVDLGDNAELQDIYDKVRRSGVTITSDLEALHIKYNEPNYHIYVRSTLVSLRKKNQVEWIGRGVYSISSEGLERLKKIAEIDRNTISLDAKDIGINE